MYCSSTGCRKLTDGEYKTCSDCRERSLRRYYEIIRPLNPVREKKIYKEPKKKDLKDPSKHPRAGKERYAKLRNRVYKGYGSRCSCCGETNELFLTIDHVNNDGAEDRKLNGNGPGTFFYRIIREGFPDKYQVLCFNCNCGKHRNRGTCPHLSMSSNNSD